MINTNTFISNLKSLNQIFLLNDKNGFKIGEKNYIFKAGKIPIVFSAPHAVKQYREGQVKLSDYLTGPLAIYLAERCNCSYFVRTFNDNSDPNYPLGITLQNIDDNYLIALKKFVQDYKQFLVIDLHGCSNNRLYDCSIWSNNYKTCDREIIKMFEYNFNKSNITIDCGTEYLGGQVTRQCSLITNAFQIEVKRVIRNLKLENYNLLKSFIDSMEESIYNTYDYSLELEKVKRY